MNGKVKQALGLNRRYVLYSMTVYDAVEDFMKPATKIGLSDINV